MVLNSGLVRTLALAGLVSLPFQSCSVYHKYAPESSVHGVSGCNGCNTDYKKKAINPEISVLGRTDKYSLEDITFGSVSDSYKNKTAKVRFYDNFAGSKDVILFYAPLGMDSGVDDMCSFFASNGFDVAQIFSKHGFLWHEYDMGFSANLLKEAMDDSRVFMDYISSKEKNINFSVVGVSLGGVHASLLAGIDDRIKAGAFVICGGDLGLLISSSRADYVRKFKEYRMKIENISESEFIRKVNDISKCVDPINYAPKLNPKNFLFIYSKFDDVIVNESSKKLYAAMGKPDCIELNSDHHIIGFKGYVLEEILTKLKKVYHKK